uniref:Uncharacterized protein n=1 Tax=Panagrolaimus davidi TaxID=227884 RepID=A0A914QYJ4_9BILA
MKVFVLILIFCWKTLCEGLTCYDSSGTNTECSESVNFCIYSKDFPYSWILGVSCDARNWCKGYGRFTAIIHKMRGFDSVDYYCCDTDLCNTRENYYNPPPQRKNEENDETSSNQNIYTTESHDAEGNLMTTSEMPGIENVSTSDSSKFTTTSFKINTTAENYTTTLVPPSTTKENFNNACEKLFSISLTILTVFVYFSFV